MAIEIPKINWFEGLSPLVKCANCINWKAPSELQKRMGENEGECNAIVAYGGAWHNAGTDANFFCQDFNPRPNVG